jgi:hypothetical protein
MEGNTNWRNDIKNDNYFDQKNAYDVDKIIRNFECCVNNLEKINPFEFLSGIYEFTKAFSILSSALSMGFSDITEKVQIWRNLFIESYTEDSINDLQALMTKEIELNIHPLNGENNSKLGFKKGNIYFKYVSGCRTMLRLSWFLNFVSQVLKKMSENKLPFNTCIKNAYHEVLAPHHPWIVKTSVGVALGFASSKRGPALKAFFGI